MPELNDAVAAAVAEWRGYREPCLGRTLQDTLGMNPQVEHGEWCCGNKREVLSAPVTALIEAVTIRSATHQSCQSPEMVERYGPGICFLDYPRNKDFQDVSMPRCHGTGRIPRDWEEIGEGALRGVLEHWYWELPNEIRQRLKGLSDYFYGGDDSDSATLAAVDKALKQMFGRKPTTTGAGWPLATEDSGRSIYDA